MKLLSKLKLASMVLGLGVLVYAVIALVGIKVSAVANAAVPSTSGYKYELIGKTKNSYGVTFTASACKQVYGKDYVVRASYSISPVSSKTVEHSSIWEAYSYTNSSNYLLYMSANFTNFNSNGKATDSFATAKSKPTYLYFEGDYDPTGSGETDAGSGVHLPNPFKSFEVSKLDNC